MIMIAKKKMILSRRPFPYPIQVSNSGIFPSPTKIPPEVEETTLQGKSTPSVLIFLDPSAAFFCIVQHQFLIFIPADLGIRSYTQT